MNPIIYYTDHILSREMADHFREGTNFEVRDIKYFDENRDGIFYGLLRGFHECMRILSSNGRNFYHVDHGYFTDRFRNRYYRITKNDKSYSYDLLDFGDDRFKVFNKEIKDYKLDGKYIIVLPPSSFICMIEGINRNMWINETLGEIKKYTNVDVIVKDKTNNIPLSNLLPECKVLVHYASVGSVEALLEGIPVITLGDFFLKKYSSTKIEEINNPKLFPREKLFYNLAYNQYNIEEIRSGIAWKNITEIYRRIEKNG